MFLFCLNILAIQSVRGCHFGMLCEIVVHIIDSRHVDNIPFTILNGTPGFIILCIFVTVREKYKIVIKTNGVIIDVT